MRGLWVGRRWEKGREGDLCWYVKLKKKLLNKKIKKNKRAMHAYMYVKVSICSEMLQVVWQYFQR